MTKPPVLGQVAFLASLTVHGAFGCITSLQYNRRPGPVMGLASAACHSANLKLAAHAYAADFDAAGLPEPLLKSLMNNAAMQTYMRGCLGVRWGLRGWWRPQVHQLFCLARNVISMVPVRPLAAMPACHLKASGRIWDW